MQNLNYTSFLCFLMARFRVHTCLAGAQGTQPWKLDGFHLKGKQLMAYAGGVYTSVTERGVDPKGHMSSLLLPCALLGLGRWQGGGSLECSRLF